MPERRKTNSTLSTTKYPLTAARKLGRKNQTGNDLKAFLPQQKEPVKKSVKDFEYLKYLNATILGDDILG